ncbi:MAG: glycosyl transferase, partial [Halioglobus sp.]|nr:glycosyl transferase [Halioglobus sp.]
MIIVIAFLLSLLLCGAYLKLAERWQIVDRPNDRSSHDSPTPHGGGIGLIVAFSLALLLVALLDGGWPSTYYLLAMAAQVLMVLGVVDDLTDLSRGLRFGIYGALCLLVAIVLIPAAYITPATLQWLAVACAAFAMLWLLNLYNFMDGIDGLAGLQAVVAAGGAGVLCLFFSG